MRSPRVTMPMHRLAAPAVELLKFQSFGWISILALRLYQVSLSPRPLP